MPSGPLHPDVQLSVLLGAILTRNCYTKDPDAVVAELRQEAGDRIDLLTQEAGRWLGFYGADYGVERLAEAVRGMTDLDLVPWVELGRRRKNVGVHSNAGFRGNPRPKGD